MSWGEPSTADGGPAFAIEAGGKAVRPLVDCGYMRTPSLTLALLRVYVYVCVPLSSLRVQESPGISSNVPDMSTLLPWACAKVLDG